MIVITAIKYTPHPRIDVVALELEAGLMCDAAGSFSAAEGKAVYSLRGGQPGMVRGTGDRRLRPNACCERYPRTNRFRRYRERGFPRGAKVGS